MASRQEALRSPAATARLSRYSPASEPNKALIIGANQDSHRPKSPHQDTIGGFDAGRRRDAADEGVSAC
jgi:hypothetical protein